MKKLIVGSVLALCMAAPTYAAAPAFETRAPIAFMKDASSGAVLYAKDADRRIPPASMAKMMTVYVAFDLIRKGELKLDRKVTVSDAAWRKWNGQGSTMFLSAGEQVSIEELLHGVITLSGNDACVVLAEGIAGTEENFVALMNKAAKSLGMENSQFGNSNGWPDEGRTYVTARDLTLLGEASIVQFPKLYKDFYGLPEFTWGKTASGKPITQGNRNPLLGKIAGADGLKTGHTREAGYGFTGSADQNGRRLVMVVAGLDSSRGRIDESVKFMNWGFQAWKGKPLFQKGATVEIAQVQQGSASTVSLVAPKNLAVTVPLADTDGIKVRVRYNGPIIAPIKAGQRVASLVVSTPSTGDQIMPLVAGEDVAEAGFFDRVWAAIQSLLGL